MDGELAASYAQLKSNLIKEGAVDEHQANLVLAQDFIAMANPEGENFRGKKAELDFLKGLVSLYQFGVAQAKARSFQGVSLVSLAVSDTGTRRTRAVEHTLNLLVGDDVADIKLYQAIAAQSPDSIASMRLISRYYTRWKGRINTRQEFSNFLLSMNLGSMPPALFAGFRQLNALRTRRMTQILLTLPNEGSAAWHTMLVNIHGEFDQFRRRALGNILRPGGRYYLELGADYSISNNDLVIKYSATAVEGVAFDGVVNVIAHGNDIERRLSGYPDKVADWLYSNMLATYGSTGFGKLKAFNFQACYVSQALATHITCLLLQRALSYFGRDRIPNVLVIYSPRASLVLTSQLLLGRPRSSTWQEQHLAFPGHVLKAFRHLIDHSSQIQVAISENFDFSSTSVDPNNLSFVDYLRSTHVLGVKRIITNEDYIDKATLDIVTDFTRKAFELRKTGFSGCAQLIKDNFPEAVGDIQKLVAISSIAGESGLLPVGEVETVRKMIGFLVSLKSARDQRDFLAGYKAYNETKVKILIDPYDPHGPEKIKHFTDLIFRLCGAPVPSTEGRYKIAYRKLFVLDKQDYRAMTGIDIDFAASRFFKNYPVIQFAPSEFHSFQLATPQPDMITVDTALRQSLLGSEQLGISTRELRRLLEAGDETRILPAMNRLEGNLNKKKPFLNGSRSLRNLQETQDHLARTKASIEKKQLSPATLKTTARLATGSSRLLGAFGVFADFRTQPFHLDFSSVKSGLFTTSDSLAVVKGVFDFTTDVGPALALRLASSASRALWQPRLDQLFFKMNKVLLPLDVLFTAVSLYRNVEGARLAKTVEEQALYITMTVIDAASFGVSLAGFILIGVPGVGVALVLVGMALAVVNILLNAIVSLSQLDNYRWDEKVGLFFGNLFGSSTLHGILTQQQMRQAADQLFMGLRDEGIDLLLTPMINDADDTDQTNPLKDIGSISQGASLRQQPRGYTLSPLGLRANELKSWADARGKDKTEQVYKGWYLRRRARARKLMVSMPSTPNTRLEVLDFGPIPTILLFGATPHLLLEASPFGWAAGESPQERALNKYRVNLHPETPYTLQFKKSVMTSKDLDSNFGGWAELVVPQELFQKLPQVSLDLSGQGRETLAELDLSRSSLELIKFKGKSTFRLDLVNADDHSACALEQVVRTVQLPAHIQFKSGETHPVMAVVGEGARITLRNSTGHSLLLLRREVSRCDIDLQASVSGFAVSV
ncbi:hypothetical protein HX782_14285 [Pseudomonas gingeri]|nr:hypothetical protein [Pseudomonas gingeri]NWA14821.1 hypothetical protein [Pseudomonas gingeri]NWA58097.1 hypothetical protein [Pseudomonas gingeri]NWA96805.1 hypothetical protein [Pseudomonas gingeri]NWB03875.1 hypothetical protein [Pseudomonas gingeri]